MADMKNLHAVQSIWRLLLIVFLNALVNMSLYIDLENAFLMSLVTCPEPVPDPRCPWGSTFVGGRCKAEPQYSSNWSFSNHCSSRFRVLNQGRVLSAKNVSVASICGILAALFLGPLADTWGRKPVLILALVGAFFKAAMQLLASVMIGQYEIQRLLVLAGVAIASLTNNFGPAARAMAADLAVPEADGRAAVLAAMGFVFEASMAIGFCGGFFILKASLASYTSVWLGASIACVFIITLACLVLKETLKRRPTLTTLNVLSLSDASDDELTTSSKSCNKECRNQLHILERLKATCGIFLSFMRDGVLAQLILLTCVLTVVACSEALSRQILVGSLQYSLSEASLIGIILPALIALGSGLSGMCVKKLGTYCTFGVTLFLIASGYLLIGLSMPFQNAREILFWSGQIVVSLSAGVLAPVAQTILSVRVDLAQQGMLFSFLSITEIFARLIGMQIFVERLFDSNWTGWKAGSAYFVAAAVSFLCIPWLVVIARRDKREAICG